MRQGSNRQPLDDTSDALAMVYIDTQMPLREQPNILSTLVICTATHLACAHWHCRKLIPCKNTDIYITLRWSTCLVAFGCWIT